MSISVIHFVLTLGRSLTQAMKSYSLSSAIAPSFLTFLASLLPFHFPFPCSLPPSFCSPFHSSPSLTQIFLRTLPLSFLLTSVSFALFPSSFFSLSFPLRLLPSLRSFFASFLPPSCSLHSPLPCSLPPSFPSPSHSSPPLTRILLRFLPPSFLLTSVHFALFPSSSFPFLPPVSFPRSLLSSLPISILLSYSSSLPLFLPPSFPTDPLSPLPYRLPFPASSRVPRNLCTNTLFPSLFVLHSTSSSLSFSNAYSRFKAEAMRISQLMKDSPRTPSEKAGDWIEHVLRHGAQHLRGQAYNIPWYQYYLFDVMAFLITIVTLVAMVIRLACRCLCRVCCRKGESKTKKE